MVANLKPGTLLNGRYLLKQSAIFLDTQPGFVPESLPELPSFLLPYLHLSAYPLHVPRPYAVMRSPDGQYVLMLESGALAMASQDPAGKISTHRVPAQLPTLQERWSDAPPLRQISWLWQISQLWDAFQAEQVAATLLNDSFLRVDGSVLRLLELTSPSGQSVQTDTAPATRQAVTQNLAAHQIHQPTLMDLGRSWQLLVADAHQAVRPFLERLCDRLERQQLNAEQLCEQLAQALSVCGQGQMVSYDLAVYTDQGPTRKRNEDACYPASGTLNRLTSQQTKDAPQLLIVCDGIGGHQGGDVASKLAIATIESRLGPLLSAERDELSATELSLAIEAAICEANDEISAQNDQAQRQARDRMGTTLVLALIKGADVYIAHLGDSRAYRISQHNCQQVTLDDDVASRQVRLGGSLYREVLLQPGSGSLIQALGMSSSQTLRPTVQRFVIDESCVFLLCSDGLSDSDRVEQFWPSTLRPLLIEEKSTAKAGKQLVDLANQYNGHDNVTVGLLSAHVVRNSDRIVPRELLTALDLALAKDIDGEQTGAKVGTAQGSNALRRSRGVTQITSQTTQRPQPASGAYDSELVKTALGQGSTGQETINRETIDRETTAQRNLDQRASVTAPKSSAAILSNPAKITAVLALIAALGGALYLLLTGGFGSRLTASDQNAESNAAVDAGAPVNPANSSGNQSSGNQPSGNQPSGNQPSGGTPATLIQVGDYLRIRQSDFPGIVSSAPDQGSNSSNSDNPPTNAETSQIKLYPNPTTEQKAIPGTLPAGSIVQVMGQASAGQTKWTRLKLCSIPSGTSRFDEPAETDASPQSGSSSRQLDAQSNGLASSDGSGSSGADLGAGQSGQPIILSPGKEGWAVEFDVAAVADTVKNLQPTQLGNCER
jgi:serine/threonine protein phosphatase PrpC